MFLMLLGKWIAKVCTDKTKGQRHKEKIQATKVKDMYDHSCFWIFY